MSKISISDLRLAGSDLFLDNESYLRELSESESTMTQIYGGETTWVYIVTMKTALLGGSIIL